MTELEQIALSHLVEAWNAFLRLPTEHADDVTEFRHGIHGLQVMIMARPARRQLNSKEIAAASHREAAAPSATDVSPTMKADGSANAGGIDVTSSVVRAPVEANEDTSLAGGLESGIKPNVVDGTTSGPDVKRAPIHQSPRKAAEAVPERAATTMATIAMVTDAIVQASDSAQSAGEVVSKRLPTNCKSVGVTPAAPTAPAESEADVISAPIHPEPVIQSIREAAKAQYRAAVDKVYRATDREIERAMRPAFVLRPHCQRPGQENCGGFGTHHCHMCQKAIDAKIVEDA